MPSFVLSFPRLVLSLLAAVALLPGIFDLPLMDRDEPRFSHATIEMMDRGEWVVPYFNGEYRFDKPPLTYWWMRVHYTLLGKSEFAARLHSVLATWLSALLLFEWASRMGRSKGEALLAGIIWLTSLQVFIHGRMAVADMPLVLFLIITQWAQWELLRAKRPFFSRWFWLYHLSVGFGFLAKGPLAILLPLLTLGIYALLLAFQQGPADRAPALRRVLKTAGQSLAGLPLSLGMVALWGIPAMIQTDYQYFAVGIGKHVVERGTGAMNGRQSFPGIYFFYMLVFLLPWATQLSRVFAAGLQRRSGGDLEFSYLFAWFLSPFVLFSFYATQLPHYILPGYPAFALLLVTVLREPPRRRLGGKILTAISLSGAFLCSAALLVAALMTYGHPELSSLRGLFFSLSFFFAALGSSAWCCARGKIPATVVLVLGAALFMAPTAHYARQSHVVIRLLPYLLESRGTSRAAWGYQEGSLTWYPSDTWLLGHPDRTEGFAQADEMLFQTLRWRVDDEFLSALLQGKEPAPTDDRRAEVDALIKQFNMTQTATIRGLNPATSSWVEVIVAHKSPPP